MVPEIRRATPEDAALFRNMRKADRIELELQTGLDAVRALALSIEKSDESYVVFARGAPGCLYGVGRGSALTGTGVPGMVGTALVDLHPRTFLRYSRAVVTTWAERYGTLRNHVHDGNIRAIRWLRWLGFEVGEPEPHGPHDAPFRPFWMSHV